MLSVDDVGHHGLGFDLRVQGLLGFICNMFVKTVKVPEKNGGF